MLMPAVQIHGCSVARCEHEDFMTRKRSLVSVVDDDESVRESLPDLCCEVRLLKSRILIGGRIPHVRCVDSNKMPNSPIPVGPGMTGR